MSNMGRISPAWLAHLDDVPSPGSVHAGQADKDTGSFHVKQLFGIRSAGGTQEHPPECDCLPREAIAWHSERGRL
jgi:hypothetical protein